MSKADSYARQHVWALMIIAALLGAQTARGFAGVQGAQHFAAHPLYFDYPAGWAVAPEQSTPDLPGFVMARPGLDAQIRVYVAPREINAPDGAVPTLLEAARSSLVLPLIEQLIEPLEALGAQVQRTRASADIGSLRINGDRWLVSTAGSSASLDAYLLALNRHLVIVIFNQPTNAAAQVAPAWDLFRRTLSIGAPAAAGSVPASRVDSARADIAAAPAASAGAPSMAALDRAKALVDQVSELLKQALELRNAGSYSAAIPLVERALALAEQGVGPGLPPDVFAPFVSTALDNLGELYRATGAYDRALPFFQRALALIERTKGPNDESLAAPLNNLAAFYYETGDYDKAEPLFNRALALFEKLRGPEHPDTATAISNLAQLYNAKNDFARAEELMRRALAIREKALGSNHADVAVSLSNLGALYDELGDPVRAEQSIRHALAILEQAKGPDHPDVATLANNLALIFKHKGDLVQAEAYFNRALAISEKALGPNHPTNASTLDNLAQLFADRGDYARAENLYKRALTLREKAFGAEHPEVAETLSNLALLYQTRGDYAQARPFYERARAIFEKKFGVEHKLVAAALDNLASLYHAERQYERAEPLMQRALAIRQKLMGADSADAAVSYNNLGALAFARADYAGAEQMHRRALLVYEHVFGAQYPLLAAFLNNLSTDYYGKGEIARAVETQERAGEINERQIALILSTGSEEQKRLFMATLAEETDYTLFLHASVAPTSAQALRLALTTVLRRKGRVLDVVSDQIASLRRHLKPEDRALLERFSTATAELAALVLKGPGKQAPAEYQDRLATLNGQVNELQAQISKRSTEFRAQSQPVTLEAVQQVIPAGAALVEFALYRPYNVRGKTRAERFGAPRYVAYVLQRGTGAPMWVELGAAAPINQTIAAWREALANPERTDVQQLARALEEQIMRPVRKLLGDTHQVFLSPDGPLNLIPFGALVDEQNRYLVEAYSITYLTSGRDLLRLAVKTESRQGAVVVADPSFDAGAGSPTGARPEATQRGAGRRSFDFANAHFTRLPGTAEEGRAISAIMPGLTLLTGAQATEAALKRLNGPLVLHIATHGFFLPDEARPDTADTRGLVLGNAATGARALPLPGENPLLRSGIALAGANARQSAGGEDGVLTALEASGLDLWGTRLVVLSACETGLGDVQTGEGVYGLRRALVLAGSEAQVISLWQVSDAATRDLMVAYYKHLMAGEGRTEALRQVQLAMIKSGAQAAGAQRGLAVERGQPRTQLADRSHPFYWASFIQSGEWRAMGADARQ